MTDILIITSYYPPEIGAASNRIFHLAEGLQNKGFKVSVITPLPNYPRGKIFENYRGKFKATSSENNIKVHRLWVLASNSKNKIIRLLAMLSYSFSLLLFCIWHKAPKTVIIQSPPLLVAFTSLFLLHSKKRKIILNVSDLWPLAGLELGVFKKNMSYKLLEKIEHYNYRNADLIMGQSDEILTHVKSKFYEKKTFLYRNFPDFELPKSNITPNDGKLKIVYAGLLGEAQGIKKLCQELNFSNIEFHIYGSGSEQKQIENFISQHTNLPIIYHGEVNRETLHQELIQFDLAIIPLLNRIYGSVPSKIFEYSRLGLPVIYFGGGEGEKIIEQNHLGWIAKAGDYTQLNKVITEIKKDTLNADLKQNIKYTALKMFDFEKQLNELTKVI